MYYKATLGSLKGSPQFQSNNDLKSFVNVKNPYGDDLLRWVLHSSLGVLVLWTSARSAERSQAQNYTLASYTMILLASQAQTAVSSPVYSSPAKLGLCVWNCFFFKRNERLHTRIGEQYMYTLRDVEIADFKPR